MIRTIIIIVFIASLAFSCQKERMVSPVVPGGERIVLLEEFTGKGCTNCPKGSRVIDDLLSVYDSNLVVVSIHAGFFANPQFFPLGEYDLRTEEGEKIFSMLGPNSGYPSGVVDRIKVNGNYQINASQWGSVISQELDSDPPVEFSIERDFNDQIHNVRLDVNGRAKSDIGGEIRISIMITESGIIDAQDDIEQGGIVDDYNHKHVLRDMATAFDGDILSNGLQTGEAFSASYEFEVSTDWVADNCEIIVFLSHVTGSDNIRVLQAGQVGLTH